MNNPVFNLGAQTCLVIVKSVINGLLFYVLIFDYHQTTLLTNIIAPIHVNNKGHLFETTCTCKFHLLL